MKLKTICIFAIPIFTVAVAVRLAAHGRPRSMGKDQLRYRLVDIGTFGGPTSGNNGESTVMNNQGDVAGFADTTAADPFAPFCLTDCFVVHSFEWRNGALIDLGALPGGGSSETNAINSQQQVVGFSENGVINPLNGIPEFAATVWQHGKITNLGTFGGNFSLASMINDHEQVVGCATNDIPDPFISGGVLFGLGFDPNQLRAFRWEGKKLHDLGTLGGPDACAVWVNEHGQITGASFTNSIANADTGVPTIDPFLWDDGKMIDIGTLGGKVGMGFIVNNRGQLIGISSLTEAPGACITAPGNGTPGCHGILWERGKLTDLGTLGGDFSIANWINDEGEIVGVASTAGEVTVHGARWKNGRITDLGPLTGDCASQAFAINSQGLIAGQSFPCDASPPRAVIWESDGTVHDLNALVQPGSGLELTDPKIINDAGAIVLEGFLSNGDQHSVVLIPCETGEEGCVDINESATIAAPHSSATVSNRLSTVAQTRLTPSANVAAWRTRMARRYRIPIPGVATAEH